MKKILGLLLVTCLCICTTSSVLTEDTENQVQLDKNTMSGTTTVSLTVDNSDDSYTVIIPSVITVNPETKSGTGTITLKAGWKLVSINKILVRLTAVQNGWTYSADDYGFRLKSAEGNKIPYKLVCNNHKLSSLGSYAERDLLGVNRPASGILDNQEDKSKTIYIDVKSMPENPGVYTDTLTFSIITQ